MGVAAQDQAFLGAIDPAPADRYLPVRRFDLDQLARQRIDQPGLAQGQLENAFEGRRLESLSGRLLVLAAQDRHLFGGEIPQGQGFDLDVEGRRAAQPRSFGALFQPVVADVAQADQRDAVGKDAGLLGIAGA